MSREIKEFNVVLFDGNEKWIPERGHANDAGFDLKARAVCKVINGKVCDEIVIDEEFGTFVFHANTRVLVKTGVFLELEPGWEAQIRPRSGMALKSGITLTNSPGTIDAGYRAEIGCILQNTSDMEFHIKSGMKIAQMVIKQVPLVNLEVVKELGTTERGLGGFGSTGA